MDFRASVPRQEEQQGAGPGEASAQVGKAETGGLLALARRLDEADQIAALDLDVAADVAPEQVIERGAGDTAAQDPRAADRDRGAAHGVATGQDHRASPRAGSRNGTSTFLTG